MAAAGKEANFMRDGVEYRLGAVRHTTANYASAFTNAGFRDLTTREYSGDAALVEQLPIARKFLDFPLLLVLEARVA